MDRRVHTRPKKSDQMLRIHNEFRRARWMEWKARTKRRMSRSVDTTANVAVGLRRWKRGALLDRRGSSVWLIKEQKRAIVRRYAKTDGRPERNRKHILSCDATI